VRAAESARGCSAPTTGGREVAMPGAEQTAAVYEFNYEFTSEDYLSYHRFLQQDPDYWGLGWVFDWVIVATLLALLLWWCVVKLGIGWPAALLLTVVAFYFLVAQGQDILRQNTHEINRHLKSQMEKLLAEHFSASARFRLSRDGITVFADSRSETWGWETVERIVSIPRHVFFQLTEGRFIIVARRLFPSDEEFRAFVRKARECHRISTTSQRP
jgi:hypothetical protein